MFVHTVMLHANMPVLHWAKLLGLDGAGILALIFSWAARIAQKLPLRSPSGVDFSFVLFMLHDLPMPQTAGNIVLSDQRVRLAANMQRAIRQQATKPS